MSLSAAAIRLLADKGLSGTDIAEVAEACEPARTSGAARQKRYRERLRNERDVTGDVTPPPNDIYSNPPVLSPKASPSPKERGAFPKPDWADDGIWRDFLVNRKRKGLPNTATAHRKLLADIARLADVNWPPGRLLEAATARGWGAIYESVKDEGNGRSATNGMAGTRQPSGRTGDGFINAIRESRANREAVPWDADDPSRMPRLASLG